MNVGVNVEYGRTDKQGRRTLIIENILEQVSNDADVGAFSIAV